MVWEECRAGAILHALYHLLIKERVDLLQTVAVGDGANDLPMLSLAGLGIAFHAKPKVKASAEQRISSVGLDGILYFLGYKDSLFDEQMIECMKDGTCSTLFPHH